MPWRKYKPKKGKYGPSYHIARGIQVRLDQRKQWTLFFENQGDRQNQSFGEGRSALGRAIKAAESLAAETNNGPAPSHFNAKKQQVPSFLSFSQQWFENGRIRWSEYTVERYEAVLRLYIETRGLFKQSLDRIGRKDIKHMLLKISKRKSPATVETLHAVISGIFNEAVDEGHINANPVTGLLKSILPAKNQRDLTDPDPFSKTELELFLGHAENIGSRAESMLLKCMAYAGLRLGEVLAMRIEYLDVHRKTYFVAKSYNRLMFNRPKHGKQRLIDLPDFLVDELVSYIEYLRRDHLKQGRAGRADLLFVDPAVKGGWPFTQRKIRYLVKKVCKAALLRVRTPHDLRHSYATLLLMAHQSLAYIQKQLGHSSISITVDIYGHWVPGEGRGGLEEALSGPKAVPDRVLPSHIIAYPKKKDFSN